MAENTLAVRWPGGDLTVAPGTEVTIGRDPASTVVLASAAVSRHHAELAHEPAGWVFTDLGSTQGSFSGGVAVGRLAVTGPLDVVLGQGADAVRVHLEPAVPATVEDEDSPAGDEPTRTTGGRLVPETAQRPGGALAAGAVPSQPTVVPAGNDDRAITVTAGGRTEAMRPGQVLTIGREDDNAVVLSDAAVSRHHARVEHDGDGWVMVDLGSSAGTWLDGERVTREQLEGTQAFVLGDRSGGVTVTTEAPQRTTGAADAGATGATGASTAAASGAAAGSTGPRRSVVAVVTAAAVLVAALAAGGWWWTHRGIDRDALARATVKLNAPGWSGSGTVIDAHRGLILTNAHVADPNSMGTGVRDSAFVDEDQTRSTEVKSLVVSVSPGVDKAAEPRFTAEVVNSDGYLDVAVVKITKTVSGAKVEQSDLDALTEVPLGDSNSVRSGDSVLVVGYPGAAQSLAPTFTEGVIAGVQGDDRVDSNNAYLNVDATIAHGNSGGLAVDSAGRMIGIPSLILRDRVEKQGVLGSLRPVELARPVIDAAIAGGTYTSPYTQPAPAGAKITDAALVGPGPDLATVANGCNVTKQPGVLAVGFEYTGFPTGKNTDVLAELRDGQGQVVAKAFSAVAYPVALPSQGCATATLAPLTDDGKIPDGQYELVLGLGGNYQVLLTANVRLGAAGTTGTTGTTGTGNGTGTAPAPTPTGTGAPPVG